MEWHLQTLVQSLSDHHKQETHLFSYEIYCQAPVSLSRWVYAALRPKYAVLLDGGTGCLETLVCAW